ncbi:MAG: hypothetical protein GEV07_12510 [Streptosporangiales bacterium]|nr:hypothetical protein [Streptosporangiales bacterium]
MMRRAAAVEWPALGAWGASRLLVLGVTVVAFGGLAAALNSLDRWQQWDAALLAEIAEYGYDGNPNDNPDPGLRGFLPGLPLLMRLLHVVVPHWTLVGLLISLVASAVAAIAMVRLGEAEGPPTTGVRATAFLFFSPFAVFLVAGYTEATFLAFAVPAWLNARRGRWIWAGVLGALAASVRITGLFLALAMIVMFAMQVAEIHNRRRSRRRRGRHTARRANARGYALLPDQPGGPERMDTRRHRPVHVLALLLPFLPLLLYATYLWQTTGDWFAWLTAQERGWGRQFTWPWEAFLTTWDGAVSGPFVAAFRAELLAAALGIALCVWLLVKKRFDELVYVGLQMGALITSTYYLSITRSTLLWWPLWLLLARVIRRRLWFWLFLAANTPMMGWFTARFLNGDWAG